MSREVLHMIRKQNFPHILCAGCGHGTIMMQTLYAIKRAGFEQNDVCVVSGIGCSSRATTYLDFDTLHTTHGRAIAFAVGIKLARPKMHVIVITGDGDAAAIGGNHLIHAARRNIDLTVVLYNNSIYGMTSGQVSPTTPFGAVATTAPYGNIEDAFDLCKLAAGAGATYVARSTTYMWKQTQNYIYNGLVHPGFALIDVISQCPTYFGRKNRIGEAYDMLLWQKERSVKTDDLSAEVPEGKFATGEFVKKDLPEYSEQAHKLIERVQAESRAK
jgi:2-oxoglutarate ferredoxin oxidoreductase subunit beta